MRTFIIKSGDESTFKQLGAYLRELGVKKKGTDYCVTVKQNRPVRSLNANGYYHVILSLIGEHTGYDVAFLHEECKKRFNSEVVNFPKSGQVMRGRSTKDLDTAEFAAYVNRVKLWAMEEFGVMVPDPRDLDYQKQAEIQDRYERVQSGF